MARADWCKWLLIVLAALVLLGLALTIVIHVSLD
jgi:hypothetical protein